MKKKLPLSEYKNRVELMFQWAIKNEKESKLPNAISCLKEAINQIKEADKSLKE